MIHTILDITLLDLLQHLGPHFRMALLVFLHILRFQLYDLGDSSALVLESYGGAGWAMRCGLDWSGRGPER
jgi:hypothetical protein